MWFILVGVAFINEGVVILEASMEEGEIVKKSSVDLAINGCQRVMSAVLSHLHSAACTPHLTPMGAKVGVAGGCSLDFAIGMQEGLEVWSDSLLRLLQQRQQNEVWCVS